MINKERFVDLHVHTNFSDSTFSPEEVVDYAERINLAAIAITDHDCIEGIPACMNVKKSIGLELIPGVEITSEVSGFEIHIVGLFIDWKLPELLKKLKQLKQGRIIRMQKMIKKLKDYGVYIDEKEVFSLSKDKGSVGRLHLARALFKKGQINSVAEAFGRFIGEDKPCYVKRLHIGPEEAIKLIRDSGGIPILAHPGIMNRDEIIPSLVEDGLGGIEVFHSDHDRKTVMHYKTIASKHNLLISGGSDCHGIGKGFPLMGMIKVPYEVLQQLKQSIT